MDLPDSIWEEVASYLRLEFGQSDEDPDSIKPSDLKYAGRRAEGNVMTHFWEMPSGPVQRWATVEVDESEYCLGMSLEGPDGKATDDVRAITTFVVDFVATQDGLKKIPSIHESLPFRVGARTTEIPVRFPSEESLSFYVEVFPGDPPDVSIQILRDGTDLLLVRCCSGVIVSYAYAGYDCLIQIGKGPWNS